MVKLGMTNNGPDAVIGFVKGFSKSGIEGFLGAGMQLYSGTIGPNEMMVLPFDWVFAERVTDSSDVIGLRIAFFLKNDEESMVSVNRWLISARKQNNYFEKKHIFTKRVLFTNKHKFHTSKTSSLKA